MYALIDCNNFYASCERVFRPDLRDKPIAILSNNDGCVIARSNEVKALGIPMGAPAFKYKTIFEQNKVHLFSSNFALYGDMSHRVMQILSTYTPEIEIYSIDEAFLKFSNFDYTDLNTYAEKIKYAVEKQTGIPISIGIAPTKALAKVANRIAKKFPVKTNGVYSIDDETKRKKALKWLAVKDIWGIGRKHNERLTRLHIKNALEFSLLPDSWVKSNMSIVGLRLKKELEGEELLLLEEKQLKKNITTSRTFEKNNTDYDYLKERISTFTCICAEKLRSQQSLCQEITIFILTNRFRKDLPQYRKSIRIRIAASNSSIFLTKTAVKALDTIYKPGYYYKKAGVILSDFHPEAQKQFQLFSDENPKHLPLMRTIDLLNKKIGQKKIKLASQDLGRTWKMKQERLSPKYTTDLRDIIIIKT